jgi:3-oxoacyl-[acyl-carrier protein] reductase
MLSHQDPRTPAGRLDGKVAVVTGASKGIGAAIALALAAAGAAVVVNYSTDRAGAQRVASRIDAGGGRSLIARADVAKLADIRRMFRETIAAFGELDILVNNAGVFHYDAVDEITEEDFHRQFNTNVLGTILATQEALRYFRSDGGSIVNIGSAVTRLTPPTTLVYSATKCAVEGITRVLSKELAPRKIRVNSINPGAVDTEGVRAEGLLGGEWEQYLISKTSLGRLGQPNDITPAVVFLASPEAAWITGEVLFVSGGL